MNLDTLEGVCAETRRFHHQFDDREPTKADRYPDKVDALHNKAARLFARRRGWKATVPRQLLDIDGLNQLRGPGWPKPRDDDWWALDHSWVFLDPRHPFITAFVAQPYDYEPEEYIELTGRLGLRMEVLGTKLSWHLPGRTTLLAFTRRPMSPDTLLDQLRAAEPQSSEEYALAWQWLCLNFPTFPQPSASPRLCETVRRAARETGMSEWAVGILTAYVRAAPSKAPTS
jgi:hypothetical protein